jgi:hypothetical protein
MAIDYGNPAAAELTWPKGPAFRCWNKMVLPTGAESHIT